MNPTELTGLTTVAADLVFPEDPRWHAGTLYISDMLDHRVYAMQPGGPAKALINLADQPSGLGFLPNGDLLVVGMWEEKLWRFANGTLSLHADLKPLAGYGINDMAVDSSGRAYVVQFGVGGVGKATPSALIVVQPDGRISIAAEGLLIGNGSRLSPDERQLIVAESSGRRISVFERTPDGALSNRRIIDLPEGHTPDGICLDSVGGIWAACLDKGVIRLTMDGVVTHRVAVPPGRSVYACMFGGDDLKTLYLCTSGVYGPREMAILMRLGCIEILRQNEFVGVSTS
jgi:sugar lactone lactonase YvrE